MMTQVDEIDKDRHLSMTFVEFLEAIVRVAEKTEIPHCLIVSIIIISNAFSNDFLCVVGRIQLGSR